MSVVQFATSPGSDPSGAPMDAADARNQMLAVKRTLEEASAAVESLQATLAAQHELEQLLKQGRAHLQDLRGRLQHAEDERERLRGELAESRAAHQRDVEQFQRQVNEQAAAHAQLTEERVNERTTFTRLLNEAESKEREMIQDRDEQRRYIDTLREASARAQSLAREIIQVHESIEPSSARQAE